MYVYKDIYINTYIYKDRSRYPNAARNEDLRPGSFVCHGVVRIPLRVHFKLKPQTSSGGCIGANWGKRDGACGNIDLHLPKKSAAKCMEIFFHGASGMHIYIYIV